jgi:hypothetical protein
MREQLIEEITKGPIPQLVSKWIMERTPFIWALKQISNSGQLGEMEREVEVLRGRVDTSPFRNPISRDIISRP